MSPWLVYCIIIVLLAAWCYLIHRLMQAQDK